ncbi:MAG: hypothetical protein ACK4TA_21845 [Saprospiraceae bacterium]
MKSENLKPHIIEILEKQDIEYAIQELKNLINKNSSLFNEIILLQERYKKNESENRQNLLSSEQYNNEYSRITSSFIKILDKIQDSNSDWAHSSINSNKRAFIIEDALEWLKGKLESLIYLQSRQNKFFHTNEKVIFSKVEFSSTGEFLLQKKRKVLTEHGEAIQSLLSQPSLPSSNEKLFVIKGEFKNISEVKLNINYKSIENSSDEHIIVCKAFNMKQLFTIECFNFEFNASQTIENEIFSVKNVPEFSIYLNEEAMANRMKRAIDDIALYFGRKEELY